MSSKLWIADKYKNRKKLVLAESENFTDLLSIQVTYINPSAKDLFVEKWIDNSYTVLSQ